MARPYANGMPLSSCHLNSASSRQLSRLKVCSRQAAEPPQAIRSQAKTGTSRLIQALDHVTVLRRSLTQTLFLLTCWRSLTCNSCRQNKARVPVERDDAPRGQSVEPFQKMVDILLMTLRPIRLRKHVITNPKAARLDQVHGTVEILVLSWPGIREDDVKGSRPGFPEEPCTIAGLERHTRVIAENLSRNRLRARIVVDGYKA